MLRLIIGDFGVNSSSHGTQIGIQILNDVSIVVFLH